MSPVRRPRPRRNHRPAATRPAAPGLSGPLRNPATVSTYPGETARLVGAIRCHSSAIDRAPARIVRAPIAKSAAFPRKRFVHNFTSRFCTHITPTARTVMPQSGRARQIVASCLPKMAVQGSRCPRALGGQCGILVVLGWDRTVRNSVVVPNPPIAAQSQARDGAVGSVSGKGGQCTGWSRCEQQPFETAVWVVAHLRETAVLERHRAAERPPGTPVWGAEQGSSVTERRWVRPPFWV